MSESKNASIAIWVAIIGLVGIVFKGILDNWDKIYPPEEVRTESSEPDKPEVAQKEDIKHPGSTKTTPGNSRPTGTPPKAPSPSPATESNRLVVTGTVVDESGQAVADAEVQCTDCLDDKTVITDKNGRFSLPFRVENQEEIHLAVRDYPHSFSVRVNDPHGRWLQIRR